MLKYKAYYIYDFETESIRVAEGDDHAAACNLYAQMTENRFEHDDDRWAFDIALDCIRTMTDEERERIQRDGEITDYHFGYGMYVRNRYVHPSKLHPCMEADIISSDVENFIYAMLCNKCDHGYSSTICPYCAREEIRFKYSDKYLYDNIVRIEYMDWDSEADRYSHFVPRRYLQIRDNNEGCGIDIAGYVERENEDFDHETYQKMSGFQQFLYGCKRYRLEYLEESAGLNHIREIVPEYVKAILAPYFFARFNYNSDAGENEYSFLQKWPTFHFDTDYLREYEHWDDSDADESCIPSFDLIFELRNGEKILIDGVQNDYSEDLIRQLMSESFVYLQFKDKIQPHDWNHMFRTSLWKN